MTLTTAPALPAEQLETFIDSLDATRQALDELLAAPLTLPAGTLRDVEFLILDALPGFAPCFLLADRVTGRLGIWVPSSIPLPAPRPGELVHAAEVRSTSTSLWWPSAAGDVALPRLTHLRRA